jgi:hypothetical protein
MRVVSSCFRQVRHLRNFDHVRTLTTSTFSHLNDVNLLRGLQAMLFEKYRFLLLDLCSPPGQTGCPLQLPLSDLLDVDLESNIDQYIITFSLRIETNRIRALYGRMGVSVGMITARSK